MGKDVHFFLILLIKYKYLIKTIDIMPLQLVAVSITGLFNGNFEKYYFFVNKFNVWQI